ERFDITNKVMLCLGNLGYRARDSLIHEPKLNYEANPTRGVIVNLKLKNDKRTIPMSLNNTINIISEAIINKETQHVFLLWYASNIQQEYILPDKQFTNAIDVLKIIIMKLVWYGKDVKNTNKLSNNNNNDNKNDDF